MKKSDRSQIVEYYLCEIEGYVSMVNNEARCRFAKALRLFFVKE